MILVGNGSLLKYAMSYAISQNMCIDKVFSNSSEFEKYCVQTQVPFEVCNNINSKGADFLSICKDRLVFSINNDQIFRNELLDLPQFRFYNIHNGIIPAYRGLPEICIFFSILNNEKEYGVSLHEIDKGIDTGKCIDIISFPISKIDTFQSVMLRSIEFCKIIFEKNLILIVNNSQLVYKDLNMSSSKLYSYKDLENINSESISYNRAIDLGIFKIWYRTLYESIKG